MRTFREFVTQASRLFFLILLAALCTWPAVGLFAATISPGAPEEVRQIADLEEPCQITPAIEEAQSRIAVGRTPAGLSEREAVETACSLIEKGEFDAAGQLLEEAPAELRGEGKPVSQLTEVVREWQQLVKQRQSGRETAYKEQLAQFDRLRSAGSGEPQAAKSADANNIGDANDANAPAEPNGPTAILAAVARTSEFADESQKKQLLADPCVQDAVDRAKTEAAQLERKGKWFEAYMLCYGWLQTLDPNNKLYADYAEQLIEKADIAGSFQDSPCETSEERFVGVKRRTFVRAVDALNFNYVSKIDYQRMAYKGVRRCRLLTEVIATLSQMSGPEPNVISLGESFKDFSADANAMAMLSSKLAGLEQEVKDWLQGAGKDQFIDAFEKVLELNLTTARLPEAVVVAQFAEASFLVLDPYTVIVWPRQVQDFEKLMTNEFSGIGVEIAREKGQLAVSSLVPDTPAYNSGLDAGDVIEQVDGVPTKDMSLSCVVKRITGPAGTKVTLLIKREQEPQSRQVTITRAKITVPTVRGWQRTGEGKWQYFVDDAARIGYVRLTSFSEKTASDLKEALKELDAAGMKGLILDLRFNSGGFFDSAVAVADEFLDEGLIVITRPRFGIPTYAAAHSKGTQPDYPMVVLINAGSASASEIVAGALADATHNRAALVGERTHGKGVVQGITHYPGEGAQLKYTMAYYHLPSGQRVKSKEEAEKENNKDWGVGPGVTLEMRSDELRKMFDVQRDNDVLVQARHDNAALPVKKHTLDETIAVDPQLSTAILVVKSKLIREQTRTAESQIPISKS